MARSQRHDSLILLCSTSMRDCLLQCFAARRPLTDVATQHIEDVALQHIDASVMLIDISFLHPMTCPEPVDAYR